MLKKQHKTFMLCILAIMAMGCVQKRVNDKVLQPIILSAMPKITDLAEANGMPASDTRVFLQDIEQNNVSFVKWIKIKTQARNQITSLVMNHQMSQGVSESLEELILRLDEGLQIMME